MVRNIMDATQCRQFLEQSLNTEATVLQELNELLDQEHQLIVNDEIDDLEKTGSQRDSFIASLLKIDADRIALCRAAGKSADKQGLEQLLNWCDPQHHLHHRWKESAEQLQHCRTLNDRNGALVNTRLKRVEGVLDAMSGGQRRNERTYSSRGTAYQQNDSGSVCNFKA
jgi:flagellar biosynthesis/type III secretory pathway chaperone